MESLVRQRVEDWFESKSWTPFEFQTTAWESYSKGLQGLVNAPTGSGKTYSLMIPALAPFMSSNEPPKGLRILWITPIRALAKEIKLSADRLVEALDIPIEVGIRTGDTPTAERKKMESKPVQLLITTPESVHVMFSKKGYKSAFRHLDSVIVDEWHELIGNKRGVMLELALSHLRGMRPDLKVWGISATIGNLDQAMEVLLGDDWKDGKLIRSEVKKEITVRSLMPDDLQIMPWTGHLGINLLRYVLPIIESSTSTLIFTNTRSQCEIWYHRLLEKVPELAGLIAMHHGSISKELRHWVEDALYNGELKAVVCTSSLDLGVDFRPVETIIQIGGPKGVSRFVQRAGRSGHSPGAESKIYFLPTHSLELVEAAAIRQAIKDDYLESRDPYVLSFDVLTQYMLTRAVSDGFDPDETLREIRTTHCFESITDEEWAWCLRFITTGGSSLKAYPEYQKAQIVDGLYKVTNRGIARRQRLSIGTIVGDSMLRVKYVRGSNIGNIEESFISRVNPGDSFWFAGRCLELVRVKDMVVSVFNSKKKSSRIPVWSGGRFPLTSRMSDMIRKKLTEVIDGSVHDIELIRMKPLLDLQQSRSVIPKSDEFLIEKFHSEEGYHIIMYPFEGRLVHEGMASLIAWRIAQKQSVSFSLAFSDYGFELLSDVEVDIESHLEEGLLSPDNLIEDVQKGINASEMARRKFRDIAIIAGLIFRGFPGMPVRDRHLQGSAGLIYEVFEDYDKDNLLFRQAHNEVIDYQLEMTRFQQAMSRIDGQEVIITHPDKPTPFAFPIMTDRMRANLSTESIDDLLDKLSLEYS